MSTGKMFSRIRVFLKYSFYITMSVLAIVNIAFFLCHWGEWTPQFDKEALLLSVVGFFFAFAGINIYSIFNTNIETEKEALRDLKDRYDGELRLSSQMLQFPQNLIMIWHLCQYIVTSGAIQSKSFDWIRDLKKRLKKQRDFVQDLRDSYRIEVHERYRDDLANLSQGILASLKQHRDFVSGRNEFFGPILSNKDNYIALLDDVIAFADETVSYDYEPGVPEKELTFWDKTKKLWGIVKKTYCKRG